MEQNLDGQQAVHYEALYEHPDLLEIYGETQVTLFGVTASLDDLSTLCPVDISQRTQEANNQFVVNALNEAEAEILPEHEGYFMTELTRRGLEPKILIREHPDEGRTSEKISKELLRKSTNESPNDALSPEPQSTAAPRPDLEATYTSPVSERIREVDSVPTSKRIRISPEAQAKFMALFEGFSPESSSVSQGVSQNKQSTKFVAPQKQKPPIEAARHNKESPKAAYASAESIEISESKTTNPRVPLSAPGDFQQETAHYFSQNARESHSATDDSEIAGDTQPTPRTSSDILSAEKTPEENTLAALGMLPAAAKELSVLVEHDSVNVKNGVAAATGDEAFGERIAEQQQAIKELLDSLMSSGVASIIPEGETSFTASDTKAEDDGFIQNFVEQIRMMPPMPEITTKEQPAVIMSTILEKAATIQAAERNEEVVPEVLETMKSELEIVCRELLESLGIEPDKKVIAAIIEKIVAADLSAVSVTRLTPQELAHLGTHEYKLEDWFRKFKKLIDASIHPHQIVGRMAINLSASS